MAEDRKSVELLLCPSCFAREIDFLLAYDAEDEEYYCQRCTYAGKELQIKAFYEAFRREKYKWFDQTNLL